MTVKIGSSATPGSHIARGAGVNLLGNILDAAGFPLLYLLVSRLQGPEMLGIYVLVTYYIAVFFRLSVLGFDKGVLRHVPMVRTIPAPENNAREASALGTALRWTSGLSALFTAVVFLFPQCFLFLRTTGDKDILDVLWWLSMLVMALPAQVLVRVMLFAIRGLSIMWVYVLVQNVIGPVSLLLLSALPLLLGLGERALMFGFIVSAYITLVAAVCFFRRFFPNQSIRRIVTSQRDWSLIKFSWPQGLTETLNFLLSRVDVIMIAAFFPDRPEFVAFYGMAALIAGTVKKVRIAFDNSFSPTLAEYHAQGNRSAMQRQYRNVGRWIFSLFVLFGGAIAFASQFILGIYGSEFTEYGLAIPILIAGRLINAAGGTAQAALLMTGRSKLELANNILINLTNIGLNLILIPMYHVFGAALATSISLTIFNTARVVEVAILLKIWVSLSETARIVLAGCIAAIPGLGVLSLMGITPMASLVSSLAFVISYLPILYLVGNRSDMRSGWAAVRTRFDRKGR
ncbi:MAG: oligosaccharide flippase family protein [Myxococcota bacterium]|nr:oligosaccharide flippase family protein [Myxococcota bacterium]